MKLSLIALAMLSLLVPPADAQEWIGGFVGGSIAIGTSYHPPLPPPPVQPPSNIAGAGILVHITNGTGPFAVSAYSFFIAGDDGVSYTEPEVYNVSSASGTFVYSVTNAPDAEMVLDNRTDDLIEQVSLVFTSTNTGSFTASITNPAASQSGDFIAVTGTAPTNANGLAFNCTISNGLPPFATNGTFSLCLPVSGNAYEIYGSSNVAHSIGAFAYINLNTSIAMIEFSDSIVGGGTAYFGFSDTNSGIYAIAHGTNFQTGSFTVTPTPPGFFFIGQASLGGDWYYLGGTGQVFGYYYLGDFPYVYHLDMGWEYFTDANDGARGAYFYDFADGAFFYTAPGLFPYLYDFKLSAWLYYSPANGAVDRYASNPRWFYNYSTHTWVIHL